MKASAAAKLRVVVADDCEDIADTLLFLLGDWGHTVAVARDGLAAVRVAMDFLPDAVLLDIGMPGIDGYEAARRIRQQLGPEVVLIAVTAWSRQEDKQCARLAGFDHHLTKPVDIADLERTLTALMMRKQVGEPSRLKTT